MWNSVGYSGDLCGKQTEMASGSVSLSNLGKQQTRGLARDLTGKTACGGVGVGREA